LQHCRIDNVTEDEFTMLQRSFENVLSLRVDAEKKKLSLYSISKKKKRLNGSYNFTVLSGRDEHYLVKHGSTVKKEKSFQTIMKTRDSSRDSTAEN
jgi:hypothetical protein